MPVVSVRIPQLGEGLQEARLVEFLKQPGDHVKRDEPIYVMETDKAVTEVESPYAGGLVEWLVDPDSVLPIGTEIAKMEVAEGVREMPADHLPPSGASSRGPQPSPAETGRGRQTAVPPAEEFHPSGDNPATRTFGSGQSKRDSAVRAAQGVPIPPRTKRYLKDKKLLAYAHQIPAAGTKLMPTDVDAFIANGGPRPEAEPAAESSATALPAGNAAFEESILSSAQQTLNYRMARGAQVALPAVLITDLDWTALSAARDLTRDSGGPSSFAMLLWCIVQAMREHPALRSSLSTDGKTRRTYQHVNLGIAVSLPGDVLKTAVVRDADTLDQRQFFAQLADRVQEARDGQDQIDAATTVTVSNVGTARMRVGIPVVVTPAVATIALGAVRNEPVPTEDGFSFQKKAALTMTFDHRLMNGVGAANFLNAVSQRVANFELLVSVEE